MIDLPTNVTILAVVAVCAAAFVIGIWLANR